MQKTYGTPEQVQVFLQQQQIGNDRTGRFARQRHLVCAPAESTDIVACPFKGEFDVSDTEISCFDIGRLLAVPTQDQSCNRWMSGRSANCVTPTYAEVLDSHRVLVRDSREAKDADTIVGHNGDEGSILRCQYENHSIIVRARPHVFPIDIVD